MSIDCKWTKDQVRRTLSAALLRLKRDPTAFEVTHKGTEVDIKRNDIRNWTSITVYQSGRVFMHIGDYAGTSSEPSMFFWQDKELKAIIAEVWALKPKVTMDKIDEMLLRQFPEMTDSEFEQHVLKPKS